MVVDLGQRQVERPADARAASANASSPGMVDTSVKPMPSGNSMTLAGAAARVAHPDLRAEPGLEGRAGLDRRDAAGGELDDGASGVLHVDDVRGGRAWRTAR